MLWIACAAGLLGLCVAAEFAARHSLRRRGRYHVLFPGVRLRLHLDQSVFPELEPVARFEVNSDGERGGDVREASHGLYRVLVAGGSPVEGWLLDQAINWPGALERILSTPQSLGLLGAKQVHVGSIGRSGVAARDLNLMLERVLPQYHHLDAIVLMIGGNDVANWLACGAPAEAPAPPVPASELFACHPEGPFGWRPAQSALVQLVNRWRRLRFRRIEVRHPVGRWLGVARAMRARATEIRSSVADPGAMLDTFEDYFGRLLRNAKARARRVLVVRQPWFEKEQYTPEEAAHFWHGGAGYAWKKETVSVYYALDLVNRLMTLVDARAVKVAEELEVEHLDVKALLEPSLNTYYDYVHYTPAGARKVAEALAAALLRQHTLRPEPANRPLVDSRLVR
jgi:lysophospholipase L1-like esterase